MIFIFCTYALFLSQYKMYSQNQNPWCEVCEVRPAEGFQLEYSIMAFVVFTLCIWQNLKYLLLKKRPEKIHISQFINWRSFAFGLFPGLNWTQAERVPVSAQQTNTFMKWNNKEKSNKKTNKIEMALYFLFWYSHQHAHSRFSCCIFTWFTQTFFCKCDLVAGRKSSVQKCPKQHLRKWAVYIFQKSSGKMYLMYVWK